MKNMLISGYRTYELGIFSPTDPKIEFIKKALESAIKANLDIGLEWVLISGQLGTELWAGDVVNQMKEDYPDLKLGVIFPHENFGNQWNEENQIYLQQVVTGADYVDESSKRPYDSPGQLQANQAFLIDHSDKTLLLYDPEYDGKPKYLYDMVLKRQETKDHELELITMFDLQDIVNQQQEEF